MKTSWGAHAGRSNAGPDADMLRTSTVQIAHVKFFPKQTAQDIENRLSKTQAQLRRRALGIDEIWFSSLEKGEEWTDIMDQTAPSRVDREKIVRRAQRFVQLRELASGQSHLGHEDRKRLSSLEDGITLTQLRTEHQADEIAARLHEEMPWMSRATEIAWNAMRESVREGKPALSLPPILLDGPPGIGKSHWARRLATLVGTPSELIDAATEPAGFSIAGSQKGWSTANPGRPLELILRERVGNPFIVIDEVDKVGDVRSNKGLSFALSNALLPLLEPLSARTWSCPYFRVRFDMRWISWVLTSNNRRNVPAPLLSRCRVVDVAPLTGVHLAHFARREGARRGLSDGRIEALSQVLARTHQNVDLRAIIKLIDGLFARENLPPLH
ncbi:AAA family ATPase [Thioclava atlantica]|uniref:ATPase central domain-containing protein n=1 Tax=Thioclava atlantica TaxID=1317124 RepID=A0A085TSC3_9RHOB|nr:AAA family ATPase [Thioclava atlantica]KFE33620.1 ATPase central domain-containing protein [Thioclava atlantica]